jgi:hypothetical protein
MCINDDKLLVIHKPRRIGGRWVVTGLLYTPWGTMQLKAEGNELLAARAIQKLQGEAVEVGGIFDDIKKAVRKIAKSKAFAQVLDQAQAVLKNPIFRKIAGKVPIVSSVVDGADAAFEIANGLRTGKLDAATIMRKAQRLARSVNPELAEKGAGILQGLKVADTASALWSQYQKGDAEARSKVLALKSGAMQGDPAQKAAYEALKAARRFELRKVAADVVQKALSGDGEAAARLDAVYKAAATGDKNAKEAVRLFRSVLVTPPTQHAEVGAEAEHHESAALGLLGIQGTPLAHADALLVRRLRELRAYVRAA